MHILKRIGNRIKVECTSWRFRLRFGVYSGRIRMDAMTAAQSSVGPGASIQGSLAGRYSRIHMAEYFALAALAEIGAEHGEILMDARVSIGPRTIISTTGGRIEIGRGTSFFSDCIISGTVAIGAGCLFAKNVTILSSTHEIHGSGTIRENDAAACTRIGLMPQTSVIVGDDCWLGSNAVILPGVTLATGTVVGANAVVTKNFPAYSIVAGVPAKLIGSRSREESTIPAHDQANRQSTTT